MNKNKKTRILPSRNKYFLENQNTGQKKMKNQLLLKIKLKIKTKKLFKIHI